MLLIWMLMLLMLLIAGGATGGLGGVAHGIIIGGAGGGCEMVSGGCGTRGALKIAFRTKQIKKTVRKNLVKKKTVKKFKFVFCKKKTVINFYLIYFLMKYFTCSLCDVHRWRWPAVAAAAPVACVAWASAAIQSHRCLAAELWSPLRVSSYDIPCLRRRSSFLQQKPQK